MAKDNADQEKEKRNVRVRAGYRANAKKEQNLRNWGKAAGHYVNAGDYKCAANMYRLAAEDCLAPLGSSQIMLRKLKRIRKHGFLYADDFATINRQMADFYIKNAEQCEKYSQKGRSLEEKFEESRDGD